MLIKANSEAEASVGFETIKPGTYRVRVKEVTDRNPEKNDLRVVLELVDMSNLLNPAGEALKGRPGSLFDYIMLDADKQWKLRSITEAAGLPWNDYDPVVDLPGRELDVVVKVEEYNGELKNKVGRYVANK